MSKRLQRKLWKRRQRPSSQKGYPKRAVNRRHYYIEKTFNSKKGASNDRTQHRA